MPIPLNRWQVEIEALKARGESVMKHQGDLLRRRLGSMVNRKVIGGSVVGKSAKKRAKLRSCQRKTTAIAVVNTLCGRRINEESQRVA